MNKPLIFAHRGGEEWDGRMTRLKGADYIELDVRRTGDGVLVVKHDRSVKNSVRRVLVDSHSYSELHKKTGRKLPKLEEVVEDLRGKVKFNFDIKQYGIVDDLEKLIRRFGIEKEVMVDSGRHEELEELSRRLPKAKYAYEFNYRDRRGFGGYRIVIGIVYFSYFALYPAWPRIVKFVTRRSPFVPGASIYYRLVNKGIMKFFHDREIPVYVFPVNREGAMRKMVELGVDGIKTSKPELLKRVLEEDL
jgi:glycerophosphoryl diester phosphodiesterase